MYLEAVLGNNARLTIAIPKKTKTVPKGKKGKPTIQNGNKKKQWSDEDLRLRQKRGPAEKNDAMSRSNM